MKGGLAMLLSAFVRAAQAPLLPRAIFCSPPPPTRRPEASTEPRFW